MCLGEVRHCGAAEAAREVAIKQADPSRCPPCSPARDL